ncbi:MAG: helix-turn-helix transcriptional regulator [Bacteroidales bacterium]|nr:helix-turn-helix transcriptional regulator [Bacteroidales bacterium]
MVRDITDIEQINACFHQQTLNRMVAVGNLAFADFSLFITREYNLFCIVMTDDAFGEIRRDGSILEYGRDSIFSIRPGQKLHVKPDPGLSPRGMMLAFSPELLVKTGLGRDFYMFNFFDFDKPEAVTLSSSQRELMIDCFGAIRSELNNPEDNLSGHILRLCISRLLSYCKRYFERKFEEQGRQHSDISQRLDKLITNYISSGMAQQKGLPTVSWCARQFNLSANYFGSLVKQEFHITAQEFIHQKLIESARAMLSNQNYSISEISESLGFAYANHFTRFFTNKVGMTPSEYRKG